MANSTRKQSAKTIHGAGDPHSGADSSAHPDALASSGTPGTSPGAAAPGVPPAPDASPALANAASAIASVSPPRTRQRNRGADSPDYNARYRDAAKKKADAEASKALANQLIEVAQALAISFAGPDAALEDAERLLIGESLPKIIELVTPEVAAQVEAVAYPGMLIVGVAVWSIRVSRLMQLKADAKKTAAKTVTAQPAPVVEQTVSSGPPMPTVLAGGVDQLATHDGRDFLTSRGL